METLSTGQSGKIAEYFVTCAILSLSGGRLSPFLPASDDHGVDLIVMDTATSACLGVQVKSWRANLGADRRTVQFDVRRKTFKSTPKIVLAALVLDPSQMDMELGWIIPMDKVPTVSTVSDSRYALSPSRSLNSADRYSDFRYSTASELVSALAVHLKE